jgi:hypothetical protein
MSRPWIAASVVSFSLFWFCSSASAQSDRGQYPRYLANSYVGLHVGSIKYAFTNAQLESGYKAESIQIPHLSVGVMLFGHEFNKYLSAQVSYIRPIKWVTYRNVNGGGGYHSVWTNTAGLTIKPRLPLTRRVSAYAEGGLGIITRKGFAIHGIPVLKDSNYSSVLIGGGLQYRENNNLSLTLGVIASPAHAGPHQPQTTFFSAGFDYTMRPLPEAKVLDKAKNGYSFPENLIQLAYTSDVLGNRVNTFFTTGAVPIFWAGNAHVTHGLSANFQHNVFHTRRVFSLELGSGASSWKSKKNGQKFFTTSIYPVFRFTTVRKPAMSLYIDYSLAGPTFISKPLVDNQELGKRFTFQDFMALGMFIGKGSRKINTEVRITHYSNGNLFPRNAGVTVPMSVSLGYAF